MRHQPPAGKDVRCLATTLSATQTAVYSSRQTTYWQLPCGAVSSREAARRYRQSLALWCSASLKTSVCSAGPPGSQCVKWLLCSALSAFLLPAARDTLHNTRRHSEMTALCLWLCAAAALDETNARKDCCMKRKSNRIESKIARSCVEQDCVSDV